TRADWLFCLRWTLATAIALTLPTLLGQVAFLEPIGPWTGPIWLGIAQTLALERYWTRSIPWGLATAIGGYVAIGGYYLLVVVSLATAAILPSTLVEIVFVYLPIIGSGAILGLAQALVLRGVSRWWRWWPLVSGVILSISIFWLVGLSIEAVILQSAESPSRSPWWYWTLLTALSGLIGGVLKSLALALFLKRTPHLRKKL
ncbi:MAG: hypothetical protein AAFQ89_10565, partial [Cyanobacteria bacterium J06626_18]